jgi:hypothetical protein
MDQDSRRIAKRLTQPRREVAGERSGGPGHTEDQAPLAAECKSRRQEAWKPVRAGHAKSVATASGDQQLQVTYGLRGQTAGFPG